MTDNKSARLRSIATGLLGLEPKPTVGDNPDLDHPTNRIHMIALIASILGIIILAIVIVQFDLVKLEVGEIPANEQIPGREVISPTAAP